MANPSWAWYEDDGVTPNATQSWSPVNGTPTTPAVRRLYNDIDGAAGSIDSEDFLITAVSRPSGVGDYTMEDELAAGGYIKIQLTGYGGTGMLPQTTGLVSVGKGRFVRVKGIKAQGYRTIEQVIDVPLGVGILAKDYKLLVIEDLRAFQLSLGHTEGGAQGLRMGIGDASFTEILEGGLMTEDATPDNTVHVSLVKKVFAGVPSVNMDELLTFSNLDVASAALTAGDEYLARVSVDATGAATVTKSAKGVAPLSETLVPAVPAGARSLGWVQVQFDALINTADIHQDDLVYGGAALVGTGTSPLLHPFEALIGNAMIVVPGTIPLTLTDDDVNFVWIGPSGSVTSNVTGLQPEDMAQLAYEVTLAAGVITLVTDCRQWIYPCPVEVTLYRQGTLAAAQVFYGVLPTKAQSYLLPIGGIIAAVGERGAVSGSTKFDVSATDRNDTYATLFTSSGTQDERPNIAFDAANPVDMDSVPEVYSFHGGCRFKVTIVSIPGTASVDASITLRLSAVGAA